MSAQEENFTGLARINRELIGKVENIYSNYRAVLDLDGLFKKFTLYSQGG